MDAHTHDPIYTELYSDEHNDAHRYGLSHQHSDVGSDTRGFFYTKPDEQPKPDSNPIFLIDEHGLIFRESDRHPKPDAHHLPPARGDGTIVYADLSPNDQIRIILHEHPGGERTHAHSDAPDVKAIHYYDADDLHSHTYYLRR